MILFLDPSPERAARAYERMSEKDKNQTIWCKTVEETIVTLQDYAGSLTLAYFEHDLGENPDMDIRREDCGMEVVRFLEKAPASLRDKLMNVKFVIHTWNKAAGVKMTIRLSKLGFLTTYRPFGS